MPFNSSHQQAHKKKKLPAPATKTLSATRAAYSVHHRQKSGRASTRPTADKLLVPDTTADRFHIRLLKTVKTSRRSQNQPKTLFADGILKLRLFFQPTPVRPRRLQVIYSIDCGVDVSSTMQRSGYILRRTTTKLLLDKSTPKHTRAIFLSSLVTMSNYLEDRQQTTTHAPVAVSKRQGTPPKKKKTHRATVAQRVHKKSTKQLEKKSQPDYRTKCARKSALLNRAACRHG